LNTGKSFGLALSDKERQSQEDQAVGSSLHIPFILHQRKGVAFRQQDVERTAG
jgi:hypothetical protein